MTVGFTGGRSFVPLVVFALLVAGCATAPSEKSSATPAPQASVAAVPASAPAPAGSTAASRPVQPASGAPVTPVASSMPPRPLDAIDSLTAPESGLAGADQIAATALITAESHTVAGLTPEKYPDVFDRIRAGFKLDDIDSPRIDQQLAFFANNPQYLERVFGRASLYMHHIVQEIEARGMPLELALLPVVESAFEPYARS